MSTPAQRTVTCKCCGTVRHVSPMSLGMNFYWFCHVSGDGRGCWTMNKVGNP